MSSSAPVSSTVNGNVALKLGTNINQLVNHSINKSINQLAS